MIELTNVSKRYPVRGGQRTILDDISLRILPHEKLGILGRNGAGKSTLVRLLSGAERPSSGQIFRNMSVSWPIALGDAFHNGLTGLDNLRLICRIYNVDYRDKIEFIQEFSELGIYLREPLMSYSSGMRARLAFAISMIIEFDCYLIDEVVAVGDSRFHEKCRIELFEKRKDRGKVIVSHDPNFVQEHCEDAAVLVDGRLYHFDTVNEGFEFYNEHMKNV
jgi:capsular polysaccharide transport system ATP-binding protein